MERFFKRLEVGKNVKRMNVSASRCKQLWAQMLTRMPCTQWSVQTHEALTAITGNHITEEDQSLFQKQDFKPEDVSPVQFLTPDQC
jgi:hypothetical protein